MNLCASRYNYMHNIHGQTWAFHARTGALVKLDDATVDIITRASQRPIPADGIDPELVRAGFLLPEQSDEVLTIRHEANINRYSTHRLDVVITPTTDCNMSCHYCFEQSASADYITDEVLDGITRLVHDHSDRFTSLHVVWYGGEPLLAPDRIVNYSETLMSLAEQANASYSSMLLTNGTLLTADLARKLAQLKIGRVQVTLDGTKANHDKNRVWKDGQGTWETIVDNICASAEHLNIVIRSTLSPENIAQAFEMCEQLDQRGVPEDINVVPAPLNPGKQCGDNCQVHPEFSRRLFSEVLHRGYKPGRLQIRYPQPYPSCIGGRVNSFVIDSVGDIHKCLETVGKKEHAVGNVLSSPRQDHRLQEWMQADPFCDNQSCVDCQWLPLCLGGCPLFNVKTGDRSCTNMKGNIEIWMELQALLHAAQQMQA